MTDHRTKFLPPHKPRHFSRRSLLLMAFLLLLLPAAHGLWGLYAERRLAVTFRQIKASGEPIYPEDFLTPTPPPGQNAVDDLLAAGELASRPDTYWNEFDRLWLNMPLTAKETVVLATLVDRRRQAFARVDAAVRKPAVQWEIDHACPPLDRRTPRLAPVREVANLLRADALLAHQQGRDDRALARIDDALAVSRIVDGQPLPDFHNVAIGIAVLAGGIAEEIAPDLRIGGPGGVTPARARATIDRLLDEQTTRTGMLRALYGERKDRGLSIVALLTGAPDPRRARSGGWSPLGGFIFKPIFLPDADTSTRMMTVVIHEFERSRDWPTFRDATDLARRFPELSQHPNFHMLSQSQLDWHVRPVRVHYQWLTERRLAATALALRCYATDHAGRLPPSLDDLVPTYLPVVPSDPMTPGDARLRYDPDPANPIVYSVGNDATDDGGSDEPNPAYLRRTAESTQGMRPAWPDNWHFPAWDAPPDRWDRLDTVLHLSRQPRYQPQGQLEWQNQPLPE